MWLIAESGSTKTDWIALNKKDELVHSLNTSGLNPTFLSAEDIRREILKNEQLSEVGSHIQELYFFGAGVSSKRLMWEMFDGLKAVFKNARIYLDHDLTAAAYSTYDGKPCISCIVGTGSNSIYFDGEKTRKEIPSLAYILGDEASGTYFSKEILRAYFYKKLPSELAEKFTDQFEELDKDTVIKNVYEEEKPNMYLASFMPFVIKNKDHPYLSSIIEKGIIEFLNIHVKCFHESKTTEIHFVGSVATLLQEEFREVGERLNLRIGNFVERPVKELRKYLIKERNRLSPLQR